MNIAHANRKFLSSQAVSVCTYFIAAVIAGIFLFTESAQAQADNAQSDFSGFLGYMLPSQIDNVTQILPLFGARYALNFNSIGFEFEGENAHAQGIDWTQAAVNLRAVIPLDQGLDALVYIGPDLLWYIPNGDTERQFGFGVHAGVGGIFQVKDSLWLRADMKFLGNPGASLYFLAGLMWRPGGSQ